MRSGLVLGLILVCLRQVPTQAATASGPDAFGYSVATTSAFSFTNITDGTRVLFFTVDGATNVDIGFNFNFYGANYTTVSFTPNGLMTFGGASTDFNNTNLTTAIAPSNNLPCIAVLWDDWETESVGADALYYTSWGTVGSRQFIVQWNQVMPVNGPGRDTVTFQARLFEGSNQILLSYLDVVVSDDPGYGNGAYATVGIRDTNGQVNNRNLLWSHNQAVLTNGENILFTRPNHAPVATADLAATVENSPVFVNVLANDSDPDGNTLTVTSVSPGTNGSATVNAGMIVIYRPNPNFTGIDSFIYTISDSQGGFATNTVSVTVWPFKAVSITRLMNGTVSVQFVGVPSRSYWIQTSSNLADWTSIAVRTADANGVFSFEQPATQERTTFFRAMTSGPP